MILNRKISFEEISNQILDETDLLRPISGKKKEEVSKIIAKAKKNRSISLRVSNYDLEKIKERANAEGIPYQTLINSILFQKHKLIFNKKIETNRKIETPINADKRNIND